MAGGPGVVVVSTDGGDAGLREVWEYRPGSSPKARGVPDGSLTLLFESRSRGALRSLPFARNLFSDGEFAGATFDPEGWWLFVNVQRPGVTFAITGPWTRGPL